MLRTAIARALRRRKRRGRVIFAALESDFKDPTYGSKVLDGDDAPDEPPYIRRWGLLSRMGFDYVGWNAPSSEHYVGLLEVEEKGIIIIRPINGWELSEWVVESLKKLVQEVNSCYEVKIATEPC
jgi:hypothetical protein